MSLCIGVYGQCVFTTPHNVFPGDAAGRRRSLPSSSPMLMYVSGSCRNNNYDIRTSGASSKL